MKSYQTSIWPYYVLILALLAILIPTQPTFAQPRISTYSHCLQEFPVQWFYEFDGNTGTQSGVKVSLHDSYGLGDFLLVSESVTTGYAKNNLDQWYQVVHSATERQAKPAFAGSTIHISGTLDSGSPFEFLLHIDNC